MLGRLFGGIDDRRRCGSNCSREVLPLRGRAHVCFGRWFRTALQLCSQVIDPHRSATSAALPLGAAFTGALWFTHNAPLSMSLDVNGCGDTTGLRA
jgi:hypothetical protein